MPQQSGSTSVKLPHHQRIKSDNFPKPKNIKHNSQKIMAKTNRFNLHKLLKPIRLVLVGILALVFVVLPSIDSPATTPEAAYISYIKGSELFIGTGTSNSREAAHVSNEVQGNRILYVPGGRRGSAHLSFIHDWPIESAGLVVQAGPDDVASQWSFPCTAGGRFTMNWKKGSDRGCEEGVRLTATEARSQGQADPNGEDFFGSKGVLRTGTGGGFTLGGKEVFTAQAGGEEVIVAPPNSEDVTIQTRSSDTGIEVDTIFSDILVKSAKHPQGRLIPEGQKYSYPQDTTMPIDRNAIINSPEMQDFLNPNNWLFPGLPENVANDLAQQVGEMRTALESVPPSPVAAQPTPSQPTAAQPTPSQSGAQPLASNWILEFTGHNTYNGVCNNGVPSITNLILTGSSFSGQTPWIWNEQQGFATINGNFNGNNVRLRITPPSFGGFSTIFNGSLNSRGEFVGTSRVLDGDCAGKSHPFTLKPASPE